MLRRRSDQSIHHQLMANRGPSYGEGPHRRLAAFPPRRDDQRTPRPTEPWCSYFLIPTRGPPERRVNRREATHSILPIRALSETKQPTLTLYPTDPSIWSWISLFISTA